MTPTPEQSLAYLQSVVMTPDVALEALDSLSGGAHLLELFSHYFPREFGPFKRSVADCAGKAIARFLDLVSSRLFPLRDLFWEEEELQYACVAIPIAAVNDDWWERDPHDLCVFDRAVLTGAGVVGDDADEYTEIFAGAPLDYRKLKSLSKGPLENLSDAVSFVFHDTGEAWLDLSWEALGQYPDEPWDRASVDRLTRIWKQAQPKLKRVRQVYAWVGENEERAARVRDLVASCVKPPKPEPVAIRVA